MRERACGGKCAAGLGGQTPQAVDASIVGLEIGFLLSTGEADRALARSRTWLEGRTDLGASAALLAGALGVGGRADLAVALLEPIVARTPEPELITALAQAEADTGRVEAALTRLERLDADGRIGAGHPTALLRLRLALAVQDLDRTMAAADRIGIEHTPADVLLLLSELAVNQRRADVLRTVLARAGQDYLRGDPVIGARVQFALGDAEAARRWSLLAANTVAGRPDRAIQLAELELQLGRVDAAIDLLGRALSETGVPAAWVRDAASLYIRAQHAEQGRLVLDRLRQAQPKSNGRHRLGPRRGGFRAWKRGAGLAGRGSATHGSRRRAPGPILSRH